jgi:glyoxylase-like metal-dependent hydrolase (beta-lactamase superfamily II)
MHLVLISMLSLAAVACSSRIDVKQYPSAQLFTEDPRLATPSRLPNVELQLIDTGSNSTLEAFLFRGGRWFTSRELTFPAALVRHPRGLLLIDTGLGPEIDQQFDENMPWLLKPLMDYEKGADAHTALSQAGVDPRSVKHILLTHLHWDHAGGLESFPEAEVWFPEAGLSEATALANDEAAYFLDQFDADTIRWHFHDFPDGAYENFAKSFDFFGDGSVVLVPMPGHTSASLGVFVNLPNGERYLFSGDTTWSLEGFQRPSHKFWLSCWLVDHDRELMELPIVQVFHLMQRYPQLHVVPSHDAHAQKHLPHLPK